MQIQNRGSLIRSVFQIAVYTNESQQIEEINKNVTSMQFMGEPATRS